jgi:hypothetical protein
MEDSGRLGEERPERGGERDAYTCIRTYTHTRAQTDIHTHTHTNTNTHTYVYTHILHTHTHEHEYKYICIYTHSHVCRDKERGESEEMTRRMQHTSSLMSLVPGIKTCLSRPFHMHKIEKSFTYSMVANVALIPSR